MSAVRMKRGKKISPSFFTYQDGLSWHLSWLAGEPGAVQNWLFSCWHCCMYRRQNLVIKAPRVLLISELLSSYFPHWLGYDTVLAHVCVDEGKNNSLPLCRGSLRYVLAMPRTVPPCPHVAPWTFTWVWAVHTGLEIIVTTPVKRQECIMMYSGRKGKEHATTMH